MNYPLNGSYMNSYNQGMNMNMNNMNMNQPNAQSGSFRNVFGVLGGLQGILHIFTSFLDLMYFGQAVKSLIIDLLLNLIRKILRLLKYMLTFKWLIDLVSKTNSLYGKLIYNSEYFKHFSSMFKLSLIIGIIACFILKYWKTNQLKSLRSDEENKDNQNDTTKLSNELNEEENNTNNKPIDNLSNIIKSEERWKFNK